MVNVLGNVHCWRRIVYTVVHIDVFFMFAIALCRITEQYIPVGTRTSTHDVCKTSSCLNTCWQRFEYPLEARLMSSATRLEYSLRMRQLDINWTGLKHVFSTNIDDVFNTSCVWRPSDHVLKHFYSHCCWRIQCVLRPTTIRLTKHFGRRLQWHCFVRLEYLH